MKKCVFSAATFAPTFLTRTEPKGKAMKKALAIAGLVAGFAVVQPASATSLIGPVDGITYTLDLNSIVANTANFTLFISGENTAADLQGGVNAGRTGVNAIAFNNPTGGTASGSLAGFSFANTGGINSSGCNNSQGNFFCFDNLSIPPTPVNPLSGLLTYTFSVTANTAGAWTGYAPDFKIDWVGTANNYDLVSVAIPVNNCVGITCGPPTPQGDGVPEPATWATMLTGFGFVGAAMRRRKQHQSVRFSFA